MNWLRNILSNYLRFGTGLAVMAIMTPVIVNSIGVEAYGQWAIIFAAVGLVSLSDLGFATAAIKFLSEAADDPERLGEVTGSLFAVYLGLTALCAAIVGLIFISGVMPFNDAFLVLGISTVLLMATSVHRAHLIAMGRQEDANWIIIAGSLFQAVFTWVLLDVGMGAYGMALAHCVSSALQALLFVLTASVRRFPRLVVKNVSAHIRRIAQFSVWALIANVCFMLILRIDPLLIEQILDPASVALFAIALKVGEQVLLFNKQFSNALLPLVSRYQSGDQREIQQDLMVYATRYLIAFAAPVTLLLAANSGDLLRLWIGDEVVSAAPSLAILAVAALVSTTQFNAANVLGMSGQPRYVATTMALSAAAKVAVGLALLMWIGIVGAAVASLIAALVFEAGRNVTRACRHTGLQLSEFLSRSVLPGIAAALPFTAVAVIDAPADSLIQLIFYCAIYGCASLALFLLFCADKEDSTFFRQFFIADAPLPGPASAPQ